jgi:hypothetical protein
VTGEVVREPSVELLWWEGCPSTEDALAMLREEMGHLNLDPGGIEVREVSTDADARREEFVGSPTIRVDGRDVQPLTDEPVGLSCRVYRLPDGRISPLPDRGEVRQTLIDAMKGEYD